MPKRAFVPAQAGVNESANRRMGAWKNGGIEK
jgi:hypothetical protein